MNAASMEIPPIAPPLPAPAAPRSAGRFWKVCLGLLLLLIAAPIALGVAVMRMDGEARVLKSAVISPDPENWQKQIELDLTPGPFILARMVAPMFDQIPPEARAAINTVRDAELSVYQLKGDFPDTAKVLVTADKGMTERGFDRIVAVTEPDALVAIYVHNKTKSLENIRASVLVIADRQMITVSAKANLAEITEFALAEAKKHMPAAR